MPKLTAHISNFRILRQEDALNGKRVLGILGRVWSKLHKVHTTYTENYLIKMKFLLL